MKPCREGGRETQKKSQEMSFWATWAFVCGIIEDLRLGGGRERAQRACTESAAAADRKDGALKEKQLF